MGADLPVDPPPPPAPPATPAPAEEPAVVAGPVVDATYRMTKGDLFRVSAAVTRHSKLSALFGFLMLWSGVIGWAGEDVTSLVFVLFCLLFGTGILPGLISAFFASRRPELLAREVHLRADASGVRMESQGSMSQFTWSTLRRVRPQGSDYVLDFGTGASTFIPEHGLTAAQRADLERLVLAHAELDLSSQWRWLAVGSALGLAAVLVFLFVTGFFAGH